MLNYMQDIQMMPASTLSDPRQVRHKNISTSVSWFKFLMMTLRIFSP
jgi:hypothetical protein